MSSARMASYSPLMQVMTQAVMKASRALVRDFGEVDQLQVSRKGTADFVTAADRRTESILQEALSKGRPAYGFLMEESGEIKGTDPEHRWIIDPLDGTNNFIHGVPHFAISIALEKAGAIVAGVTYDPLRDELFWAERGQGAFLNNRRLRVSTRQDISLMLFATCHSAFQTKNPEVIAIRNRMEEFCRGTAGLRRGGSATLDLAYVAAGRFDGFWETNLNSWDMAAGILLVQEAGGYVADLLGEKNMLTTKSILASNSHIFPTLQKTLRGS